LHHEWNDPDFADSFPPAEAIFIATSANRTQVESWLAGLESDGAFAGWPYGKPKNAPDLAKGHSIYWVSWY
jgi:hypothetical protein